MVYVDELFKGFSDDRRAALVGKRNDNMWCHMWCVGPVDELHALAKKIGLKQEWFQNHKHTPHYDLTPKRREAALKAGAEEFPARQWAIWNRMLRYDEKEAARLQRQRLLSNPLLQ